MLLLVFVGCSSSKSGLAEDAGPQDVTADSADISPVEDVGDAVDTAVVPPTDITEDVPVNDAALEDTPPPTPDVQTPDVQTPDVQTPDVVAPPVPAGSWKAHGQSDSQSLAGDKSVGFVAMALDTDERPVVAYTEKILLPAGNECPLANRHIFLTRFNGQEWTGPDGVTDADMQVSMNSVIETEYRYAFSPSVDVLDDGSIIVAWTSALSCKMSGLQGTVMARRYVPGTGWEDFGTGSTTAFGITGTNYNQASRMRIDPMGRPTVAYMVTAPGNLQGYIYLRRFVNGEWTGIDGSDVLKGISGPDAEIFPEYMQEYLSLAFTPAGEPVVAWTSMVLESILSDFSSILMRYWDGKAWVGIDGSAYTPGVVPDSGLAGQNVSTTVTSDGRVHLAWSDMWTNQPLGNEPMFYASALPNGNWEPADGGGATGFLPVEHHVSRPTLITALGDRPILGHVHHHGTSTNNTTDSINVLVKNTDTQAWETLGGVEYVVEPTGWRVQPVALDGSAQRVGMAWVENDPKATKAGGGPVLLGVRSRIMK